MTMEGSAFIPNLVLTSVSKELFIFVFVWRPHNKMGWVKEKNMHLLKVARSLMLANYVFKQF